MPYQKNGVRNYKKEYKAYHSTTTQKKNRAARNTARRQAEAAGSVKKGDGNHVDHKKGLMQGGTNAKCNRRVVKASTNLRKEAKRKQRG